MCRSLSSEAWATRSCPPAVPNASSALRRLHEVPVSFLRPFARLLGCPAVGHIDLTNTCYFLVNSVERGGYVLVRPAA